MPRQWIIGVVGVLLFSSCSSRSSLETFQGRTMGTTYTVKVFTQDPVNRDKIQKEIDETLRRVNQEMSTYLSGSEIDQVNRARARTRIKISRGFEKVLRFSLDLAQQSGGFFDPTIGPLVNLWGFGPGGERKVPTEAQITEARARVGARKVRLEFEKGGAWVSKVDGRVQLDLSAAAKGFGVDEVSELLTALGYSNHLVDIGGELRASGSKGNESWVVAIENPEENQPGIVLKLALQDASIATSGSYRNFFEQGGRRYSHTIDFRTGRPIEHPLISVSIVDASCMRADGLATALHAMGPERAWSYALERGIAAFLIHVEDSKIIKRATPAFEKVKKHVVSN